MFREALFQFPKRNWCKFLQIDLKADRDFSISPYASMGNNPILLTDPLGDVTKYFAENGKMIWQTNEPNGNYANIIKTENSAAFTKSLSSYFGSSSLVSQEQLSANLSSFGTTYDLSSFENFYDKNVNKFEAKSIARESLEGASNFYIDDKPTKRLNAEAGANLVMNDDKVVSSDNVGSSGKFNGLFKDDIPSEKNSTGRAIHLHQRVKVQYYKKRQ